ncbi:MAG: GntR family transcriptional regulator [Verrucomicrobiales bacterium]
MLPFHFQLRDGIPVSEQLAQAVRRAILAGELEAGQEFPSVRVLAKELRISPTTAQKVIGELKAEGYLASRPGIGMVISAQEPPPRRRSWRTYNVAL